RIMTTYDQLSLPGLELYGVGTRVSSGINKLQCKILASVVVDTRLSDDKHGMARTNRSTSRQDVIGHCSNASAICRSMAESMSIERDRGIIIGRISGGNRVACD